MAGERRRRGGDGLRERPRERGNRRERAEPQRGAGRGWGRAAALAVAALALGLAAVEWDRWSAASRLVTPHPAPPALPPGSTGPLASPHLFWGTYRPHVYFGMKTRLMWLQQREGGGALRHTCEQSDGLSRYGWRMHDGESFGVQEIRDEGLVLKTEFVKRPGGEHGGDWSWRVTAAGGPTPLLSLFFYVATDEQGTLRPRLDNGTRLAAVTGTTEELGRFTLTFLPPTTESGEDPKYASYNYLEAPSPGLHRLTELVRGSLSNRFPWQGWGGPA
uniref:Mannosyl-oligosaccharide glucosidase n=1 Tax=Strix occidentalis caurina TaxID=311401 RepID=A0A8D0L0E5_STROC